MSVAMEANLAEVLSAKLLEARDDQPIKLGGPGTRSPTASTASCQDGTPGDNSGCVSDEESAGAALPPAKPRFMNSMMLSQIDWTRLTKMQEWRTVIQLKGLPVAMCRVEAVEAVLRAHGMSQEVLKVKVSLKPGARTCRAELHAASTEAVARLSRFFHGRQFPGSKLPVSVSFAENQVASKLAEPKRVRSELFTTEQPEGLWLQPPPGLEQADSLSFNVAWTGPKPELAYA